MQFAGSPSWRMDVSGSQLLDHAMFVRDTVGLPVPQSPEVPPPLGIALPDRGDVVAGADRAVAGQQWLWWWRKLMTFELTQRLAHRTPRDPGEDSKLGMQRRMFERDRAFDPPTFATLRPWPELHAAAVATVDDVREWQKATNHPAQTANREHFDWALTRDVAEGVIAGYGARPDQVNAIALVIEAPTAWFHLPRPGVVICSTGLTKDHTAAGAVLRQTFTSGLKGW